MSSVSGWKSIADLVDEASANLAEYHGHYFGSLYNYAVDCLKMFNYDYTNTPKEVYLPVDQALKRVILPGDFVNYLGVGYEHNGNIIMLGYNGRMTRPKADSCGVESLGVGGIPEGLKHMPWNDEDPTVFEGYPYPYTGWAGWAVAGGATLTNYYAMGGGWNVKGYYKVHKDKGYIDFNPDLNLTEIILVYTTNGFKPGEQNMLPEMMWLAMKHYVKWQFFSELANISGGRELRDWIAKANRERELWIIEARNAAKRQRNRPQYELLAAYRRSKGAVRM